MSTTQGANIVQATRTALWCLERAGVVQNVYSRAEKAQWSMSRSCGTNPDTNDLACAGVTSSTSLRSLLTL